MISAWWIFRVGTNVPATWYEAGTDDLHGAGTNVKVSNVPDTYYEAGPFLSLEKARFENFQLWHIFKQS